MYLFLQKKEVNFSKSGKFRKNTKQKQRVKEKELSQPQKEELYILHNILA